MAFTNNTLFNSNIDFYQRSYSKNFKHLFQQKHVMENHLSYVCNYFIEMGLFYAL